MNIIVPEGPHSPLGPSSAKRWMNCPASVAATRDIPGEQSVYAASGSASHYLSEICRNEGHRADKFLGTIVHLGEYKFEVDHARVDSINRFLDYVDDIGGEQFVELLVRYEPYVTAGFGTSDHIAVKGDTCHVIDLKDGEGIQVWAEECEQLMLYALGWYVEYGWLYPDVRKFVLHIVQPRLNHFDKWEIDLEGLMLWAADVTTAAAAVDDVFAPFNPGPWCAENFCKIRGSCKARASAMLAAAEANPNPHVLKGAELARVYDQAKQVTKWAGAVKAHVTAELMHGREVGGKKLVSGKNNRVFEGSEKLVLAEIKEAAPDVDTAELYTKPELKSVAQIEDILGKDLFAAAKEAGPRSKEKPEGKLHKLVKLIPCAPTIVDAQDRRPALKLDPTAEFEKPDADEWF